MALSYGRAIRQIEVQRGIIPPIVIYRVKYPDLDTGRTREFVRAAQGLQRGIGLTEREALDELLQYDRVSRRSGEPPTRSFHDRPEV